MSSTKCDLRETGKNGRMDFVDTVTGGRCVRKLFSNSFAWICNHFIENYAIHFSCRCVGVFEWRCQTLAFRHRTTFPALKALTFSQQPISQWHRHYSMNNEIFPFSYRCETCVFSIRLCLESSNFSCLSLFFCIYVFWRRIHIFTRWYNWLFPLAEVFARWCFLCESLCDTVNNKIHGYIPMQRRGRVNFSHKSFINCMGIMRWYLTL